MTDKCSARLESIGSWVGIAATFQQHPSEAQDLLFLLDWPAINKSRQMVLIFHTARLTQTLLHHGKTAAIPSAPQWHSDPPSIHLFSQLPSLAHHLQDITPKGPLNTTELAWEETNTTLGMLAAHKDERDFLTIFSDEDRSRRGSRSRNSQGFDDGDDLQMDGFPPSHVSNRMEGLTLENQTPPRTPNSISGQRQQRGAKRRASSPSEGSGSTNRRSPVGGYTPRLSPNASLRSQGPGAFSSASRGPGSSISTSTSSASTGWSYNASNAPSAASSIHSGPISHVQSIPFSQPPQSEQGFESKSLTPRSFVALREREIQPAKTESNELATAPRAPGRFNGFSYICDCCPKKPKKFETRDELE